MSYLPSNSAHSSASSSSSSLASASKSSKRSKKRVRFNEQVETFVIKSILDTSCHKDESSRRSSRSIARQTIRRHQRNSNSDSNSRKLQLTVDGHRRSSGTSSLLSSLFLPLTHSTPRPVSPLSTTTRWESSSVRNEANTAIRDHSPTAPVRSRPNNVAIIEKALQIVLDPI